MRLHVGNLNAARLGGTEQSCNALDVAVPRRRAGTRDGESLAAAQVQMF